MNMGLEDFMNSLADKPINEIDKEYFDVEKRFEERFGHIVPREMLPPSVSVDDIKEAMKVCIESGNDNILEVLNVEINEKYLY